MAKQTLAVKYRPQTFEDVTEQGSIKVILQQQLSCDEVKNAYLFCGGAGTGKTTCARIFANEINHGQGNPIEMDAASHNGVDDVRDIIQQAKTKSIDSEYKIFIIDECHAISNTGWQAFLKIIEEPPAKSIFLFCTTDPQKIPKTILSRVQRYDFHRISQKGIFDRLHYISLAELGMQKDISIEMDALEYIAKLADGGMRDAITMLDKCISYSTDITLENVVKALGTVDYDMMMALTDHIVANPAPQEAIEIIEAIHADGKDLRQFIKSYLQFLLDLQKYSIGCDWRYISIPKTVELTSWLDLLKDEDFDRCMNLLKSIMTLNTTIKYSGAVKYDIEATILCFISEE